MIVEARLEFRKHKLLGLLPVSSIDDQQVFFSDGTRVRFDFDRAQAVLHQPERDTIIGTVEDFSSRSLHHFRGSILVFNGFRIWKKNREFQYELWHRDEQIPVQCELMDPSRYVSPFFELRQTVDKSGPAEPPRASLTCHDPAFEHPALVLLCFYLFDLYSSSRPI